MFSNIVRCPCDYHYSRPHFHWIMPAICAEIPRTFKRSMRRFGWAPADSLPGQTCRAARPCGWCPALILPALLSRVSPCPAITPSSRLPHPELVVQQPFRVDPCSTVSFRKSEYSFKVESAFENGACQLRGCNDGDFTVASNIISS